MHCKPTIDKQTPKLVESADSTSKDNTKASMTAANEEPTLLSSPEMSLTVVALPKAKTGSDLDILLQNKTVADANGGPVSPQTQGKAKSEKLSCK